VARCSQCGAVADGTSDDDVPLGWTVEVTNGAVTIVCPACTRSNVRSIEAKLDREWW
jgi:hypothetical protein